MPRYTRDDDVEAAVETAARRMHRIEWLQAEANAYARLNAEMERYQALQDAERLPLAGRRRLRVVAPDDGVA